MRARRDMTIPVSGPRHHRRSAHLQGQISTHTLRRKGGFQHDRFYRRSRPRWCELARTSRLTVVLGDSGEDGRDGDVLKVTLPGRRPCAASGPSGATPLTQTPSCPGGRSPPRPPSPVRSHRERRARRRRRRRTHRPRLPTGLPAHRMNRQASVYDVPRHPSPMSRDITFVPGQDSNLRPTAQETVNGSSRAST
jgi:hypothetical protein